MKQVQIKATIRATVVYHPILAARGLKHIQGMTIKFNEGLGNKTIRIVTPDNEKILLAKKYLRDIKWRGLEKIPTGKKEEFHEVVKYKKKKN